MDKPNLYHDIILMRESVVGKIITPNKSARKSQDVFFSKRFIYLSTSITLSKIQSEKPKQSE